jgi:hypothetical protein
LVIPAGEAITRARGGHPRSIEEAYFCCAANISSQLMGLGGSLRSTTEVVTAPNRPIASTMVASLSGVGDLENKAIVAGDPVNFQDKKEFAEGQPTPNFPRSLQVRNGSGI